jgi:hypothetical protein
VTARGGAPRLRGRSETLGDAFDLLAAYQEGGFLFERGGLGVATSKAVVATAPPGAAARMLTEIDRSVEGGGRTVAAGALPFVDPDGTASALSVASRSVRRSALG